ncbi:MAG: hypothetical protein ACR2IM_02025 [Sediminibacterium sp.]
MSSHPDELYKIPISYRKMENLHIVFWLFKDVAWFMFWKPLGIVMIIPTLSISIIIAYRTRKIFSELAHNLAITVWIMANSFWMCSEFLGVDNIIVFGNTTIKHLAMIPFVTGLLILGYYYLIYKPSHKNENLTL